MEMDVVHGFLHFIMLINDFIIMGLSITVIRNTLKSKKRCDKGNKGGTGGGADEGSK